MARAIYCVQCGRPPHSPTMRARGRGTDRLLAALMFTDIVGSTELAGRLGDRGWKQLVARHNSTVRRELRRFGGRELDTAGDGFFVRFDRPAQAIDCAASILRALQPLDLHLRVGIHMGEAEVMGGKVGGIAVHAAARVMSMAAADEILVTSIVKDLAAGADITFEDRGVHELRGIPGEWRIFRAESTIPPAPSGVESDEPSRAGRVGLRWIVAGIGVAAVLAAVVTALVLSGLTRPPPITPHPDSIVLLEPSSGGFLRLVDLEDPSELVAYEGAIWATSVSGRTLIRVDPATWQPGCYRAARSADRRGRRPRRIVDNHRIWFCDRGRGTHLGRRGVTSARGQHPAGRRRGWRGRR